MRTIALVAAFLAAATPSAGQLPPCDPLFPCRWTFDEPIEYDLGATFGRRAGSVAIGAAINTVLAALNGQRIVPSLWKSLAVSLGFELTMAADSHLMIGGGHVTPLGHVVGRVTNSLSANIVHGAPLCKNVRTGWLLIEVTYDCGDIDLGANLTPLLGAAYFQLDGGELDARNTLALGVPVFRLSQDHTSIIGLAAGGAIGYERRPVPYTERTFDDLEARLESTDLQQLRLLELARDWGRRAEQNRRLLVTFAHERRHTNQFDYVDKLLAGADPPWFVHERIEILPRVHLDVIPAATAAVWLLSAWVGPDDMPWEYPARADEQGVIDGNGLILLSRLGGGLRLDAGRQR